MASDNTVIVKEIRDRSAAELESLLASKREELHGLRFKHSLGQLEKTHTVKMLRRDIARIQTVLTENAGSAKEAGGAS